MFSSANECRDRCYKSYSFQTDMIEAQSIRKRSHRIKTTTSQTPSSLLISLDTKFNSAMFRQEISKVDTMLSRQARHTKYFSNHRSSLARRTTLLHKSDFGQKPLNYFLMDNCNNEQLVSRLLEERGRWLRSETRSADVSLIWGFLNSSQAGKLRGKEVISRIPQSCQMTDKGKLYENVSSYCDKRGINLNFLPITFHMDREGPSHILRDNVKEFLQFFDYVKENTTLTNTWILKPTNMNQGRDIHLFKDIDQFLRLIGGRTNVTDAREIEKSVEEAIKCTRSLIIQKYIENPLLLDGHKFDIRMWALVDHLGNFYAFEEGYLRFTSTPYRLDAASLSNNYIHLTNHSLQKHSPNYSKAHSLRPMSTLSQYLATHSQSRTYDRIMQQMKRIMTITMKATLGQLSRKQKHQCFEIFGFDFLLDRQLNVRLIEANCNPAITEDCPLLAELIPKMLNDAFKLTIDRIYNTKNPKNYHISRLSSQNSWEKLGQLVLNS